MQSESNASEGRNATKIWSLVVIAVGALVGGPLGLWYGRSLVRQACEKPDASNLCGLTSAPTVPIYIVIGAIIGASAAAVAVAVVLARREP